MRLAWLATVCLGALAATPAAADVLDTPFSVGINCPCWWPSGDSIAGSLGIGVTANDAIRLNVASYTNHSGLGVAVGDAFFGGDGDDVEHSGRILDVGVAWTNYSRALWQGFTYELGLLRRAHDMRDDDTFSTSQTVTTHTATYAFRAQVGWSWLLGKHVFIAAAVGLSLGTERGTETITPDFGGSMPMTTDVSRIALSGEGYLRIGFAR